MKGLILQGVLRVVLIMAAPFSLASPVPVLDEGVRLVSVVHHSPTPHLDQEIYAERFFYRELAAIPNSRDLNAVNTIRIRGDRVENGVGHINPYQEFFSSGLGVTRVITDPAAPPEPRTVAGQVSMSSVPIPGALSLFLTGLLCSAVVARKKLISYRREAILD